MAVSIIRQLRSSLLPLDFNNCILLFSNLPPINVQSCIEESVKMFVNTPESILMKSSVSFSKLSVDESAAEEQKATHTTEEPSAPSAPSAPYAHISLKDVQETPLPFK
jgi:hypothetical protein